MVSELNDEELATYRFLKQEYDKCAAEVWRLDSHISAQVNLWVAKKELSKFTRDKKIGVD